jgi:hypothetical protein
VINGLEVAWNLLDAPSVELLDLLLLGSPLHSGGLHILDLREPCDDHCWLYSEKKIGAKTRQCKQNSLVAVDFPIAR